MRVGEGRAEEDPRFLVRGSAGEPPGRKGSVFDLLEDMDADECLAAMLTVER